MNGRPYESEAARQKRLARQRKVNKARYHRMKAEAAELERNQPEPISKLVWAVLHCPTMGVFVPRKHNGRHG